MEQISVIQWQAASSDLVAPLPQKVEAICWSLYCSIVDLRLASLEGSIDF